MFRLNLTRLVNYYHERAKFEVYDEWDDIMEEEEEYDWFEN